MILITILIFLVILGLLIFVHELGHFIIAKRAGMRVEEFGFGFPPRLYGIKRGETTYSINWIPLGGFVRILGEDGSHRDDARSFSAKKAYQRFFVLIAGVTMNLLLAVVLLTVNNMIGIPTAISDDENSTHPTSIQITAIAEASPAQEAGLKIGDVLVSIDGTPYTHVRDVQHVIEEHRGNELALGILRGDHELTMKMTPREEHPEDEGALGIGLVRTTLKQYPWTIAPWYGLRDTFMMTIQIIFGFFALMKGLIAGQTGIADNIAGPVGIVILTKQFTEMGISYLIQFTALLSINLAIINILPLPALDGGRILFIIIEKIKRSPIDKKKEGLIHTIGFISLLVLMGIVTLFDVLKFKEGIMGFFQRLF